jgi:2-aminoadipate transaminase
MRINFSGVDEPAIREGVRRIGEVVSEQLDLFGALTGKRGPAPQPRVIAPEDDGAAMADVLHLVRDEARQPRRRSAP